MAAPSIVLRVQSKNGTKRVEVKLSETVAALYAKVAQELKLSADGWLLYFDRGCSKEVLRHDRKTIKSLLLKHGDILYLQDSSAVRGGGSRNVNPHVGPPLRSRSYENAVEKPSEDVLPSIAEDEIDVVLSNESGLVPRKKDPQLCRHGDLGKCLHCSPLEPYDEDYLKTLTPPAKHMAFHSYLKLLKSGASRGKYTSMEDVNCKIKPGCKEHPPWPKGICTKCQPSAVILNRQKYRHVDNIMFENPLMMDRFLNYWRRTGHQRVGYLYGNYEKHDNVPLGIRATVAAIYEPPQDSTRDRIELKEDPYEEAIELLAANLGLRRVGWMFSDLVPDETKSGQVKHVRHKDSHYLSAQETIMAATFQNKFPNTCKESTIGKFGSKFVTVVISGNEDQEIHYDGWQVSNQCMALVRDDCLVPTIDDPALGYVKESTSDQYVPDVFYKDTDSYGNEVMKDSRPMPIEYFLIEVPAAFPREPLHTFIGLPNRPFPIENRERAGDIQNFNSLIEYIRPGMTTQQTMDAFLDLHFLFFLATNDMLPLKDKIGELCKALRTRNVAMFESWLRSEEWKTVELMMHAHAPSPPPSASGHRPVTSDDRGDRARRRSFNSSSSEGMDTDPDGRSSWTCRHCTYANDSWHESCDMCGLPKN